MWKGNTPPFKGMGGQEKRRKLAEEEEVNGRIRRRHSICVCCCSHTPHHCDVEQSFRFCELAQLEKRLSLATTTTPRSKGYSPSGWLLKSGSSNGISIRAYQITLDSWIYWGQLDSWIF